MFIRKLSMKPVKRLLNWTLVLSMNVSILSAVSVANPSDVHAATSNLTLTSSNQDLTDAFNWAKSMALSKVQTGIGNNIPSYQAALQNRSVFCMRDWAHQVDGAHLLGLDNENYSMLRAFASLQTSARKWYSIWEVNYDGSISPIDYKSDTVFWRNLVGMFELVDKGYRQYQWTANSNLLNDTTLNSFYSHTLNEFISQHDGNGNGIAEEHSNDGFKGVSSYNEGPDYTLREAADGLSSQYQAFLAYSKMLAAKGDSTGANTWNTKATNLRNTFNSNWYSSTDGRYIRGFTDGAYAPVTNFGYESSWFIPLKEISNPGTNNTNYLDFIYNSFNSSPSPNIEAWTYLPDVFYTWNQNDRAWNYLKHVMDSRSDYPEVSFTTISAIATGMMGIQPDAGANMVTTLPRLPSGNPSEVAMVDLNNVPLGTHNLEVKHEGNVKTTLTHNSGSASLSWEAEFPGAYANLSVNGTSQPASTKSVNGTTVSYVTVNIPVGQSVVVATGATPPQQAANSNLINNPGFESGSANWVFTGGSGTATNNPHTGSKLAYLDAGTSNKISQTITIGTSGTYTLSGWVSAGSTGGILGIKVNGTPRASANIPNKATYNQQTISNMALNSGDSVEIYVTGPSSQWVNIDDFSFIKN
ncbi:carbohydrate-binding protein [Paenibacillus alba]|uniref:CBM6 domain-containing protein n=1 Tax=Paenibacillus alba TaxID=1197127 RepID=A0ABU6G8A0_9BACL|nr:hypothetical protein [Paenibacillus alba]MEC0230418.1 hypothetical protein [Paenibacillus alba]